MSHQQHITGALAENGSRDVHLASSEDDQEAREKKLSACRNAIFLTDPFVDRESLASTKGKRLAGTCEWITQNTSYKSWLDGDSHLLWISGGPGKGKTMLSIFLTEELERTAHDMENTELLFYFCSHGDKKRNTAVTVLRGLVHQIVTKLPKLLEHAVPYFDTPEKAQMALYSLETLWIVFTKLLEDPDLGTIFCVLDGLDECDENTLKDLVPKIANIGSLGDSQQTAKLKLVVISRDIAGLQGCPQIKLDPDNDERVTSDIERLISARVEELQRIEGFNEEFRATVHRTLLERSGGTFLWVGFVMNELSQKRTHSEVLETVENLPSGLSAIYNRMLLHVESRHRKTSLMILRWVTMAFRPLLLQELAAAIGIEPSASAITRELAIRDEIAHCGLFLKVQGQGVSLTHQSAKDYLLQEPDSNKTLEEFYIKSEETHLELARTCFDCIAHSSLNNDGSCRRESPLLNYAVLCWPEHARGSSTLAAELFSLSKLFFRKNADLWNNWWSSYRAHAGLQMSPSTLPLLHIACYFSIIPWVQVLLTKKSWRRVPRFRSLVDKRDENGQTALFWAAARGNEAVMRLLAKCGADPNAKNNIRVTALYWAFLKRDEVIVHLLAELGADTNMKTQNGFTILSLAAIEGDEVMVRLLAKLGANINAKDSDGWTALFRTAIAGDKVMVQLLAELGADVDAKECGGWTAFFRVATKGDKVIVRLLAELGANINAKDIDGWTALSRVAVSGNKVMVRLLAELGADINTKDNEGRTALDVAAIEGDKAMVQLLESIGAEVNAMDNDGQIVSS